MAWTQSQLDALEAAIANGTTLVAYGDKRVQYRSLDEMIRIRDLIKKDLSSSTVTAESSRVYADFSKGTK